MEKSSKTMEKWNETLGKSRKMVCRRRCIWGGVRTLESKGVPKQLLSVVGQLGLFLSTCICWAPMWDHYEEKALLDGPSSEVHLGRR